MAHLRRARGAAAGGFCLVALLLMSAPSGAWQEKRVNHFKPPWPKGSLDKLPAHLQQARKACRARDGAALEQALDEARQAALPLVPLRLGPLHVLAGQPQGQGAFTSAPGAVVQGNTLMLYARVRNFAAVPVKDDPALKRVDIRTDASFYYEDGQLIATKENIGVHHLQVREVPLETFMVIELKIKGLPAQAYLVKLTATDLNSGKKAQAQTRFVVP